MATSRLWALIVASLLLSAAMIVLGSEVGASPIPPRPELWLMNADGTAAVDLGGAGLNLDFDWAPDGRRLAYWNDAIYIVDVETREQTRLDATALYPGDAEWSPSGDQIAYSFGENNVYGIRVIDADGSDVRTVLIADQGPGWLVTGVDWSPDATQISFVQGPAGGSPAHAFVLDIATGLTRMLSETEALYADTDWSPAGDWISFTGWDHALHVVSPTGLGEKNLSEGLGSSFDHEWSPDGQRLAFDAGKTIYVVDPDTAVVDPVAGGALSPSWSPDASRLVFSRKTDLFTVSSTGTGEFRDLQQLSDDSSFDDTSPAWSPDGARIAFVRTLRPIFCPDYPFPLQANVIGTGGKDQLEGTRGNDVIAGLGGNDVIRGLRGNDIICGGSGNDTVQGGSGFDTISGQGGHDTLRGRTDPDDLNGGRGDDLIMGGGGADTVSHYGTGRELVIDLEKGLVMGWGTDTLDSIESALGSTGNDTILGTGKMNVLGGSWSSSSEDRDVLLGRAGDDQLSGNAGGDWLRGGSGDDSLFGGPGHDECYGGPGRDLEKSC